MPSEPDKPPRIAAAVKKTKPTKKKTKPSKKRAK